jgi:hypothetical protein
VLPANAEGSRQPVAHPSATAATPCPLLPISEPLLLLLLLLLLLESPARPQPPAPETPAAHAHAAAAAALALGVTLDGRPGGRLHILHTLQPPVLPALLLPESCCGCKLQVLHAVLASTAQAVLLLQAVPLQDFPLDPAAGWAARVPPRGAVHSPCSTACRLQPWPGVVLVGCRRW